MNASPLLEQRTVIVTGAASGIGQAFALGGRVCGAVFQPLRRGPPLTHQVETDHGLGFGLYIASEVVKGHGGTIGGKLDETETIFPVRLPRFRSK